MEEEVEKEMGGGTGRVENHVGYFTLVVVITRMSSPKRANTVNKRMVS